MRELYAKIHNEICMLDSNIISLHLTKGGIQRDGSYRPCLLSQLLEIYDELRQAVDPKDVAKPPLDLHDRMIAEFAPEWEKTYSRIASRQVQNRGTVAGNICMI